MKRLLAVVLMGLILISGALAATWTPLGNFLYKPDIPNLSVTQQNAFNTGLNRVDARLAEVTGFLNLARLELGDCISMDNSFFPAGEVFEVYAISVDLSAMQVTLSLVRFLGETQ